jgi:hypothetical protein
VVSGSDEIAAASCAISLVALGVSLAPDGWRRSHRSRLQLNAGEIAPYVIQISGSDGDLESEHLRLQVRAEGRWRAEGVQATLQKVLVPDPTSSSGESNLCIDSIPLRWSSSVFDSTEWDNFSTSIPPHSCAYAYLAVWRPEKNGLQIDDVRDKAKPPIDLSCDRAYRLFVSITATGLNSVYRVIAISSDSTLRVAIED